MNNGGFLGFGRGAPTSDTAISRYVQSPVYYNSTTVRPPPGTKKIHVWLVGGGGGAGSWSRARQHYHHYDDGQRGYQESTSEAGGGGFGGAALYELPVTTDPIVLTIGAGGAGPTGVGGASTITIGGVMFAKVGGGAAGAGNNDANQHSPGAPGRFGGGGSGGNRQTSSSYTEDGNQQHTYHASYGTGSGGGEPPNSARGGATMLSWLYPEGNNAWRATGHVAQTEQTDFPTYINLSFEGTGDIKVPGSFVMPGPTVPLQAPFAIEHVTQGHHSYSRSVGVAGTLNAYSVLYPFPLGTAFKPVINRDRGRHIVHNPVHSSHVNQGAASSVRRGAFGWFGAGGWGGSGADPQQTESQAEPNGFGSGGGAGGGQGNHGGGGGGPNLHQDSHNPAIGFTQSPGTGGSFTSTPHLWGLRTGQTTGPGGAGLFTPVTGQNGGAGGGGAGVQNSTQNSQQQTPGMQHVGWGELYPHTTRQGGRAQGIPTGGGGCAVFRFYL